MIKGLRGMQGKGGKMGGAPGPIPPGMNPADFNELLGKGPKKP